MELSSPQKRELVKDLTANYIADLPPTYFLDSLNPYIAILLKTLWHWVGKELDAALNDEFSSLANSGLHESEQKLLKSKVVYFQMLSIMFFHGGEFIKKEAEKLELDLPFKRPSEMVKQCAFEMCLSHVLVASQDCYRLPSKTLNSEIYRELKKLADEEIPELNATTRKRWKQEIEKLNNDLPPMSNIMFWTYFFNHCFEKYKDKLPAYRALEQAKVNMPWVKDAPGQMAVINGEIRTHSRSSKKKPKPSQVF